MGGRWVFLSINGNDFAKKLIDFGDYFLSGMVVQRNYTIWQDTFKFLALLS